MTHVGAIAVALLAGYAVLGTGRARAWAVLGALVLTPVLLVANLWHSSQLRTVHHHPLYGAVALVAGVAVVGLLAWLVSRAPRALPLLLVAALPFRLPITSGGHTSNLLVPLYLVIAAGALVFAVGRLRGVPDEAPEPPNGRLEWLLVALFVLYAIQSLYTIDFSFALKSVVFFYVPFALMFVLLRRVQWDRRLLLECLWVLLALAFVFALVGFWEYHSRHLLLNPKVISTNAIESYFRVNSLFYDPNIYGRYLALVMTAMAVVMAWARRERDVLLALAALGVLWLALMTSISQSSIVALLVGLAVIAALRWSVRVTLLSVGALAVAGAAFLLLAGSSVHFNLSSGSEANNTTSGRYTLVKGGVDLFTARPVAGYGSGSFQRQYQLHHAGADAVSASHTIPITIGAEQGLIGLLVYVALLVACFGRLFGAAPGRDPARVAIAAAFSGLMLHTLLYADFLEDPTTWLLLGIGTALAAVSSESIRVRAASPTLHGG
jgi:O-antigen ligase